MENQFHCYSRLHIGNVFCYVCEPRLTMRSMFERVISGGKRKERDEQLVKTHSKLVNIMNFTEFYLESKEVMYDDPYCSSHSTTVNDLNVYRV